MSDHTSIEWADATWSPVSGCTKVSDGCLNCYIARTPPFRMAHRRFDGHDIGSTTGVQLHPERLGIPLHWRKPRRIFVCSLADLFHDEVPTNHIASVWDIARRAPQHTFIVLTKRHARMHSLLTSENFQESVFAHSGVSRRSPSYRPYMEHYRTWPVPNVWVGVTAENQKAFDLREKYLRATPAAVRFISAEPLLGEIDATDRLDGIDWMIVGGESGSNARPMHPEWAQSLRDQCIAAGVPFLFKQWGEHVTVDQMPADTFMSWDIKYGNDFYPQDMPWRVGKKRAGRLLDGHLWDQYPQAAVHA